MDNPIPFALRVAAGLIATGVEKVRTLPEELPSLSVSLAGHAARLSLRVQQELASLAAAGDEIIDSFTRRTEEQPVWAHFDEDDAAEANGVINDASPAETASDTAEPGPAAAGPRAMPDYDELRITQVRSRMVGLDAAALQQLLDHERAHLARPSFVTMLQNRITTVSQDPDR